MKREEIVRLYAASPFMPKGGVDAEGLREALRRERPGSPDWHAARAALADLLDEAGSDDRWLPRLRWSAERITVGRQAPNTGRRLVRWVVEVKAGTPDAFLHAAALLRGCANTGAVMGWHPGELRLLERHDGALVFTAYDERIPNASEADIVSLPGGFPGLAWLYFHLRGES